MSPVPRSRLHNLGSDLQDAAARFHRDIMREEVAATSRLLRAYGTAWHRFQGELDKLLELYQAEQAFALAQGVEFVPSQFVTFQAERLRSLRRQLEGEVVRLAALADVETRMAQRAVIAAAQEQTLEYVQMQLAELDPGLRTTFAKLPKRAFEDLIGYTGAGSPLQLLFASLPARIGPLLEQALLEGLLLGQNPRDIARAVRAVAGGNLARLLTIARTEINRAQREAAHRNYQANTDIIGGWIWMSAHSPRTCAACWALHGTVHPVTERMADHPNGRCAPAPLTKTWRELGIDLDEEFTPIENGVARFALLKPEQQIKILGPAAYRAYKAGKVRLEDFIGIRYSSQWGATHYARSLKEILGAEQAGEFYG